MSTGTDRETRAFRAAYAAIVDGAPTAPEFEDLRRRLGEVPRSRLTPGWRRVVDRPAVRVALAAAVVIVVVFPILGGRTSALAAIEQARTAFHKLTSFRAILVGRQDGSVIGAEISPGTEVDDRVFRHDLWYQGSDGWRVDIVEDSIAELSGGPGSQTIWDGNQLITYRADENTYAAEDDEDAGIGPLNLLDPNNATWPIFGGDAMPPDEYFLNECRVAADERIAGRTTRHLQCEEGRLEIWLDIDTGLVLKSSSDLAEHEVTSFEVDPEFDAGIFEFNPPPGSITAEDAANDPYTHVALTAGETAPVWEGLLVGDRTLVRLEELRGKPTLVLLWADWCEPCVESALPLFAEIHATVGETANLVTVDVQGNGDLAAEILADASYDFPVVLDAPCPNCALPGVSDSWGVEAVPIWVVLDPDGVVVDVLLGDTADAERLNQLLASAGSQ